MAFIGEIGPRLAREYPGLRYGTQLNGTGSLMRPYRDIRFSPDKRPYKENAGIIFWVGDGKKVEQPCFYFHIDSQRAFFYGGQHIFPKVVLDRFRHAVADEKRGAQLEDIVERLEKDGLREMEEPACKRVPRGFPQDHPREAYLRQIGFGLGCDLDSDAIVGPDLVETSHAYAVAMRPLMRWLAGIN